MDSSRRCTRRIGRDSPNYRGSGKRTSNSLAPTFRVILASTPDQNRQINSFDRRMRIGAAQRGRSGNNGKHVLAPGDACVPRAERLYRYRDTVVPKGAHV